MAGQIRHVFTPEREIQVTSLACGPAREVFDAFEDLGGPENFRFNLLDIDEQALDFLRNDLQGHPLESLTQIVKNQNRLKSQSTSPIFGETDCNQVRECDIDRN